jgi:hypothetical protein
MSRPSKAMRNLQQRDAERGDMAYRSLEVRASTLNVDARTIEATVSTETPVLMPDWQRGEMVPEVLQSKGAIIPDSRQVPFLDSHNRGRVADQLGSARDIGTKYNNLTARLHFSEAASSEFTKVREGHVTDVSAGYEVLKRVYVGKGETRDVNGKSYTGPVNVVTKWRLREVSLTPIGADQQAKLRGLDPEMVRFLVPGEEFTMLKELRDQCVARGMDANLSDDDAQRWLVANQTANPAGTPAVVPVTETRSEPGTAAVAGPSAADIAKIVADTTERVLRDREEKRAAFIAEVDANCALAGLSDQAAHCRTLNDISAVRAHLTAEQAKRADSIGYSPSIRQTGSGQERLMTDMGTALALRAMNDASPNEKTHEKVFPVDKRGKGSDRFRYATPYQMAEEYVRSCGIDIMGLSREQVAICAMFGPEKAGVRSAAYHTTGSFTNLTLDAMNKSMMVGYSEVTPTWRGPMRQASSVPDFKTIHRLRMGAIPNLPIWNDNKAPESASFADAREYYAVECRSLEISYSYKLLVNDDMDALSRTPGMMGAAAARTLNAVMWSQITSNPTMSDGKALFLATAAGNRMRSNLTTGSASPTVATVQTLTNKMRQMRGENVGAGSGTETESADILNLQPVYLVGPGALETTILQLVNSIADPAASQAGVFNTARYLQPIIEPLLDVASTTAFYLFASPSQIDTVEVSFLQGQETPITRNELDYKTLSQSVTVLQTYGAKAMNHRGMQKHDGA